MFPDPLKKLIDIFSKFPTIGPRTATRFVFYLVKLPEKEFDEFLRSLKTAKNKIKLCSFCFKPFEPKEDQTSLCEICQDSSRDRTLLAIVEKETDLESLEKTEKYKGFYFILGGAISRLRKENLKKLRFEELKKRIKNPTEFGLKKANFKEILIATNPTTEGETTRLYLERLLKPFNIRITKLARGLPLGGELEYADEETLSSALEGRR